MKALGYFGRRRGIILAAIIAVLAVGAQTLAATPESGGSGPGQPRTRVLKGPAMSFFLAKGAANACGPGCNEWIAAEGVIDRGTADRLRELLGRLSGRKLPIYFQSRGGLVDESIKIGRLLHRHQLTAGVAHTILEDCRTATEAERADCDDRKRSGRPLTAQFRTAGAYCLSACVYALVGAPVRDIAPNASLGVHASKVTLVRPPARQRDARATIARASELGRERLLDYLAEIGMSSELYRIASRVSPNSMHRLTREELARLKIAKLPALANLPKVTSSLVTESEGLMSSPAARANRPHATLKLPRHRVAPEMSADGIAAPGI